MHVEIELQTMPEGNGLIVANLVRESQTPNGPQKRRMGRVCSKLVCLLTGALLYDYGSQADWIPEWSRLLQRMGAPAEEAESLARQVAEGIDGEIAAIRRGERPGAAATAA